jgi:vacuolar-type H+-ATPase subunit D/Vma8
MNDPIKQKAEAHRIAAVTLKQQCDGLEQSRESLKFARSILIDELEATKAELARRIAEFDSKITDIQAQLEASQAALLEFQVKETPETPP